MLRLRTRPPCTSTTARCRWRPSPTELRWSAVCRKVVLRQPADHLRWSDRVAILTSRANDVLYLSRAAAASAVGRSINVITDQDKGLCAPGLDAQKARFKQSSSRSMNVDRLELRRIALATMIMVTSVVHRFCSRGLKYARATHAPKNSVLEHMALRANFRGKYLENSYV